MRVLPAVKKLFNFLLAFCVDICLIKCAYGDADTTHFFFKCVVLTVAPDIPIITVKSVMLPAKLQRQAGMPTKKAVQLFLEHTKRYATATQKQYKATICSFLEGLPPVIEQVTPEHIERFILSQRLSNNSKNTLLIPIRSLFSFLKNYYGIANTAAKVKNFRKQPFRQRVISYVELNKILAGTSVKERPVIKFLAFTGLRAQEFCDLTQNNISPDQKYIDIIGKGGKRRIIPLNKTCRQCLPFIFYKKFTRNKLTWLCKKLARKAGIPKFGPHALRHFFVTELIKKNVPLAIVSKIVGHSSPVITMKIYCHLFTPDLIGATDVIDF